MIVNIVKKTIAYLRGFVLGKYAGQLMLGSQGTLKE